MPLRKLFSREKIALAMFLGASLLWWMNFPHQFFRPSWTSDFPPLSRLQMAKYFVDSHSLRGMSCDQLKKLLAFGDRQYDSINIDADKNVLLTTDVSPAVGFGWAKFTVVVKDNHVVGESLFED